MMAFGDSQDQQKTVPLKVTTKTNHKLPTSKEKWNELLTQIRERAEWLAEMEYLGEASPHRDVINGQIAERMRALDSLGVDSECSSTRSTATGFSTTRSTEKIKMNSTNKKEDIIKRSSKQSTARDLARRGTKDENVAAYYQFSPLQYSPRRRV